LVKVAFERMGQKCEGANKEKKGLLDKLDVLDKKAEVSLLSAQEADLRQCLHSRLSHLLREEELKWYQRSKVKHLLEGDANTKYFQLLTNGGIGKHIFSTPGWESYY
jgi:hypothetical protein